MGRRVSSMIWSRAASNALSYTTAKNVFSKLLAFRNLKISRLLVESRGDCGPVFWVVLLCGGVMKVKGTSNPLVSQHNGHPSLEIGRNKRTLDSIPETIRYILSEYLAKS